MLEVVHFVFISKIFAKKKQTDRRISDVVQIQLRENQSNLNIFHSNFNICIQWKFHRQQQANERERLYQTISRYCFFFSRSHKRFLSEFSHPNRSSYINRSNYSLRWWWQREKKKSLFHAHYILRHRNWIIKYFYLTVDIHIFFIDQ